MQQNLTTAGHPIMLPQAQRPLDPKENRKATRDEQEVVKIPGQENRICGRSQKPPVQNVGGSANAEERVTQISKTSHGSQKGTNQQATGNGKENVEKEYSHRENWVSCAAGIGF